MICSIYDDGANDPVQMSEQASQVQKTRPPPTAAHRNVLASRTRMCEDESADQQKYSQSSASTGTQPVLASV